jgi:TPR repeat protein
MRMTCKRFNLLIIDDYFKSEWIIYNINSFYNFQLFKLGFTFFNLQVINNIKNIKKIINKDCIMRAIYHIAHDLHRTEIHENRIKAFQIFKILDNNYFLGTYYDYGLANIKMNNEKAKEHYKLAISQDSKLYSNISKNRLAILKMKNLKKDNSEKYNKECLDITNLLHESANFGNISSCYLYGDILFHGKLNNPKCIYSAFKYIKEASKNNNEEAKLLLKKYYSL